MAAPAGGEPIETPARAAGDPGPSPARRSTPRLLLDASRPRQWIKNALVFAAPGAAGLLSHPSVLGRTAVAAGIFLVASTGTYLVNDTVDAAADRVHPEKRSRPVASGALSPRLALAVGGVLLALAVTGAGLFAGKALLAVVAAYAVVSVGYSLYLKHVPVIELACVSSGFVLRAVAGGAAVHIPISPWFAIVTSACALLVVTGKRSAELTTLSGNGASHRRVLAYYPASFLRSVRVLAATVAVMSYALWAFDRAAHLDSGRGDIDDIVFRLSILPFVLGVLSVELSIESGHGGAPEELALRNRGLQVLGLACVVLVAVGIYT
ncbi:MAG TPA: decaprenyl-phosphate phosphoribosyltransferase [Acidimicrobiales bacterium]|nr:decaprenyl-phosphate phosphoribosyltransferase [Acidimicrobiales bacterium]